MTTYSNPRLEATIPDWPSGKQRVTAHFWVEIDSKRGQRACRRTTYFPPGASARTSLPKKLTYARKVRLVDGDDGRIYILQLAPYSGIVSVMRGTMDVQHEVIYESDPRYPDICRLLEEN